MKRFIKYGAIPVVTFLFLLTVTIIALPVVLNVQNFIPEIESRLSNMSGRTVSIGSNFAVSFFPYLSVSFSDLKIDNPEGYLSDSFLKIESFEGRVKLLPLLRKKIDFSRFIIGGLEVNLEKKSDGRVNWDFTQDENGGKTIATTFADLGKWSVSRDLSVALFAITGGTVVWSDRTQNTEYRIDDLMLLLHNFTLDTPVALEFKASHGGKSLVAEGQVGPVGQVSGIEQLPVDLTVNLINFCSGQVKGKVVDLLKNPSYNLELHIPPFAANELVDSLHFISPFAAADSKAFSSVGIDITAKGDIDKVLIENGRIKIDDTLLALSLTVKRFDDPEVGFALDIAHFDLDRYLPHKPENQNDREVVPPIVQEGKDSGDWRKINMAGTVHIGELIVGGGRLNDVQGDVRIVDGIFKVTPFSFVLYQGKAQSSLTVNLQNEIPQTTIDLKAHGVQTGPLLHDFLAKDFLSGSMDTDMHLQFSGNNLDEATKSLGADGFVALTDGALKGIDMLNPLKNTVGLTADTDSSDRILRTDFSELKSNFTIKNGLVESHDTMLTSSGASVAITGTADLGGSALKLMIKPKVDVVKTEEQGAEKVSKKGPIPFGISGTFAQPQIDIDGRYLSLDDLKLSDEVEMQDLVDKEIPSPVDEDVRDLVGTTLIDPAVVAQRFGLQPELNQKSQAKKQPPVGSGRVRISPLRVEETRH